MSDCSATFKDPRWQKKRLELLQKAGWTCEVCEAKDSELNIHHRFYSKKSSGPWDYPDKAFSVLCKTCHKKVSVFWKWFRINCGLHLDPAYIVDAMSTDSVQSISMMCSSVCEAVGTSVCDAILDKPENK
jgi:hypothetical protein